MAPSPSTAHCNNCDRTFSSISSLHQHYRDSSIHNYCQRCDRHFVTRQALWQHEENSYSHWICGTCDIDFWSAAQLEEHELEEHPEYDDDDDDDDDDDEGYETDSYDQQDQDLSCIGCGQAVTSFSAMLVHLESGNCDCRTTRDALNHLALRCPASTWYVVRGREEFLRQGQAFRRAHQSHYNARTQYWECPWCNFSGGSAHGLDSHLLSPVHDMKAFVCPELDCRRLFVNLSGLVAHVESQRCGEGLWDGSQSVGKMLDFLEGKLSSRC